MDDHIRQVTVFGFDSNAGSNHAYMVDSTVASNKLKMSQEIILMINQAIEIKGLNHDLLCPMKFCLNGVVINKVPKFCAPVPSETIHTKCHSSNNNLNICCQHYQLLRHEKYNLKRV